LKSYRYGNVFVPLSDPLVQLGKLTPERGIQLVGFMNEGDIPPEMFMGASKALFADKNHTASMSALVSLATAMVNKKQVALLRLVLRAGSSTKLMVAFPVTQNPAYFVLKEAPFMEDVSILQNDPLA
jgi:non-homologous end joining protein Ku